MNTLLMLFIFVPILAGLLLGLNLLFAVNKPNEAKESVYECGFNSVYGQTRSSFQIHFFIVALLFLIFDLEVLLLYPLAVTLYKVSIFGFSVALIFFIVLTIGFILEIGSGAISLKNSNILNKNYPLPVAALTRAGAPTNYNIYKNNRMIKQATFCTSAVISKENLKDISTAGAQRAGACPKIPSYWDLINEVDRGQETNNPHIIAKRILAKGGIIDANKINSVLSQLGHKITQEELDKLSSIKPVSILFDDLEDITKIQDKIIRNAYNAKVRSKLSEYLGGTNTNKVGVYIWTNLEMGKQNVGCSTDLYKRVRSYFNPSLINTGKRLINKNMKKSGVNNFKLDIYIIDTTGMDKLKIRFFALCLEQYYIFKLNPSLNSIKVAESNSPKQQAG